MEKVLEVNNLVATFTINKKEYEVLRDISFSINKKQAP